MENNTSTNDESLDSVPQPIYEALQDEEAYNGIKQAKKTEDSNYNMFVATQKDDEGPYNSDHDVDKELISLNRSNETNDNHSDEDDYSLDYEEDGELCEYVEEESESHVEHISADKPNDALIVQGNDGMIKKIKICHSSKDIGEKYDDKKRKIFSSPHAEGNNKFVARSSTPMSREYLALQRSVNESKILTKFVTDAANEKPRKLRTKESVNSNMLSTTDHSYSSVKKSSQLSTEKPPHRDGVSYRISPTQGKRQYSKRYAPLKDSDSDVDSSSNLRPRSRSKSMHNSEFHISGSIKKLKRWPSEERLNKRANMRSENSEFAQKQMEFLQRVIHSCENPRSRSRSRSCGRKTPTSLNEQTYGGVGGSGISSQQQKYKSSIKEQNSKCNKYDMGSENDDQILGESNSEHPDDEYINESQASLHSVNSSSENTFGDIKEVEARLKNVWQPSPKVGYDSFCWKCHENKVNLCCCKCIRSFHAACIKINKFDNIWMCPECTTVENLLNNPKRSRRNELPLDLLSQLLSFALKRMRYTKGHYSFVMPYEEHSIYKRYIANPVSLGGLQSKIEAKEFRCAEEFVNETKWLLHNAYIISNRNNTKLVLAAKSIFKICRQEANEIETCAECYLNANTRADWFVDVCSQPHLLLWAKLKGFPYWPAKAMGLGQNSLINVRFFGEHDRAFVPLKDCFLYSLQDPNTAIGKKAARELADCIKEVEDHISKIRSKVGGFKYAAFKTPYEPTEEIKQLTEMMPGLEDFMKKQQGMNIKPSLQFKIYKTADNNLSIVQKASTTPELISSSHDIEEKDKEKKKKLCSEVNDDCKKSEDLIALPAKYEVVSKIGSDDTNSSKLGTVILKRKSLNSESKKANDEDAFDMPLPKITKIEEHLKDEPTKLNSKRKFETQIIDKPKGKNAKLEPKIPIMTIRTSLAKASSEIHNNEVNAKVHAVSVSNDNATTNQAAAPPTIDNHKKFDDTQKAMQNFVKHKQGVTIKKICKDVPDPNSAEESTLNSGKESHKASSKDKKLIKQKTEDEKARENQKVNSILKGLVPFVEVKQEVLSDNEEEAHKQQTEICIEKESKTQTIKNNEHLQNSSEIPEKNSAIDNNNDHNDKNVEKAREEPREEQVGNELMAEVKLEVVSDEDEQNQNTNSNTAVTHSAESDPLQANINDLNSTTEKESAILITTTTTANENGATNANTNVNSIRVVGDTTIQKLPPKCNQPPSFISSCNLAANSNTGSSCGSSNIANNNSAKRISLKGVPYGPLPASAFPKGVTSKSFQQSDINLQPRAKKSFPQISPPIEKLRPINNSNSLAQITPPTNGQHFDQKRTMSKNTMVTIPVDIAANRASTSVGTIIIGSIPVPPLTAVSKTLPTSQAHNSTARNSPATITVSGTSGSLTTASVMVQTKPSTLITATTYSTIRNSPITVTSSSTILAPISSTLSLSSAPVSTTTLIPLTMTTPPPLAGLSGNSLPSTSQTNAVSELNNSTIISAQTSIQPTTETHILGGLVTPTLASAITDVICKGPPKLVVRPSGPLQSEGFPMFPSQTGPVCKRLVENVHKLTDFFISVVEDTMGEMAQGDDASLQAKITLLTMELERSKDAYEQEIAELKRTSDLMLCEMRKSLENEKTRLVVETRKQCEMERLRSVEETKRKQWCANCFREANFYCCWNTSYCDYPCQQLHWARHSHTCAQTRSVVNETPNTATTTTHTERHQTSKANSTMTLNSTASFSKLAALQKKEKAAAKSCGNHMISTIPSVMPSAAPRTNTEVLKLPSNTYLRPINNQTVRCNTTYSLPIQRFNATMPITTPANSSSPQTYTIVQQGNSWVMSSAANNNGANNSNSQATISPSAASNMSLPHATRPTGSNVSSLITTKTTKTQIRYH